MPFNNSFGVPGDRSTAVACRVNQACNEATATGVAEVLNFDTEEFDTDTMHDPCTNPERITVPTTGKYIIQAAIEWANQTGGTRRLRLIFGTATIITESRQGGIGTGTGNKQAVIAIYSASASNYFTCEVFQDSGSAIDVTAATFSAILVSTP